MPMNPLKISVAGVRGIVGETFTPDLVIRFSRAFATYLGGAEVAVCRDTRPSSGMVHSAVLSGLLSCGSRPVDLGVCPVPTLELAVAGSKLRGGIAISAGHNPLDWNALKFVRHDGIYLNEREAEELLDIFHLGRFLAAPWSKIPKIRRIDDAKEKHFEKIVSGTGLRKSGRAGLKVVVDACGGTCGDMAEKLLKEAGCEPVMLNTEPGKKIPHYPEPTPRNMDLLSTVVRTSSADAGFMFDTGGERLGVATEKGEPLPDESTLLLCALAALGERSGPVVTNLSTTHALEEIAEKHRSTVTRVPIGQAYVAEEALKTGAVIAGEGSGGVIVPEVQAAQDSLAAMALIIRLLQRGDATLSEIVQTLPRLHMLKKKLPMEFTTIFSSLERARKKIESNPRGAALDMTDGIKTSWKDSWVHIRASNTQSLIRIIAEAKTQKRARELIAWGEKLLK
ncbi:MAG: hypothetical protein ABIH66_01355 [bacterium]